MTTDYTDADVEDLLRDAMNERADAFRPHRHSERSYRAIVHRSGAKRYWNVVSAVAAVAAVAVGAVALVGTHQPDASIQPAAPSETTSPALTTTATTRAPETVEPLPGGDIVTPLADPVTVSGSGTQTVHLGVPPQGTDGIDVHLTCLTVGYFEFSDGAAMECRAADIGTRTASGIYRLPATAETRDTTITAAPGQRWRITATYIKATVTEWGVNDRGQTYGVQNASGTPDLVAAMATNGEEGYVFATELTGPQPANPSEAATFQPTARTIPVYESDGVTQIGVFTVSG